MPTPAPAQTPAPTPAPSAPDVLQPGVTSSTAAIDALRLQAQVLTDQMATLRGQRAGLETQSHMLHGPARAAIRSQLAQVNDQIAAVSGDLANVRAQIGARQAPVPFIGVPPRFGAFPQRHADPDLIVGLGFAFIFAVMMPIAIAHARRVWRGKPIQTASSDELSGSRLARLEQAVDSIAIEVERVSEGQRFLTKVLGSGSGAALRASGLGNDNAAAAAATAPDATPVRALGAGPIEPIRMPERQAVRPLITPH
jgi:hypothetical protein